MSIRPSLLVGALVVLAPATFVADGVGTTIDRLAVSASYDRSEGSVVVEMNGSGEVSAGAGQTVSRDIGLAPGRAGCPATWEEFRERRGALVLAEDDREQVAAEPYPLDVAADLTLPGEWSSTLRPASAGVWRACAWVTITERAPGAPLEGPPHGEASGQASAQVSIPAGSQLTDRVAIDTLLGWRRTPSLVKDAIARWRAREPGYGAEIRWARLSPDRYPEAVIAISPGGAGRRHAYYVVSAHGQNPRVVFARHRAFNVSFRVRGRSLLERLPVYAPSDPLCCASSLAIRTLTWKGGRDGRLRVSGRSRVRLRR